MPNHWGMSRVLSNIEDYVFYSCCFVWRRFDVDADEVLIDILFACPASKDLHAGHIARLPIRGRLPSRLKRTAGFLAEEEGP